MKRPAKLQLQIARKLHGESGAHMRARIRKTAFLRSLFWQGAYGGKPPDESADPRLQKHLVDQQLEFMKLGGMLAC